MKKQLIMILTALLLLSLLTACGNDAKKEQWLSCQPGDTLLFGSYEQDNDLENGPEDIEWIVLDRDGSRVLVVSKYTLDAGSHKTQEMDGQYWAESAIRTWLNGDFLNTAFTPEQQAWITMTTVDNSLPEDWLFSKGHTGDATEDHVFLLREEETMAYFAEEASRVSTPTAYAKAKGATSKWWLRSLPYIRGVFALVNYDGEILEVGHAQQTFGIRPAMWVDCEPGAVAPVESTEAPTAPKSDFQAPTGELGTAPDMGISPEERCSVTGNAMLAQTESGYYMLRDSTLYYADKTDLTNWVPVCNDATCNHAPGNFACNAYLGGSPFWLREDGIYYYAESIGVDSLDNFYFIRRNFDGSVPTTVYTSSEYQILGPSSGTSDGTGDSYLTSHVFLLEDGSQLLRLVLTDKDGAGILFSETFPAGESGMKLPYPKVLNNSLSTRGDALISSQIPLGELTAEDKANWEAFTDTRYYHVHDGELLPLNVPETCDIPGSYISGNHFFHYHVNDGFYYMDLSTGEEVKIAHAAYENGYGLCLDGMLMVETTMDLPAQLRDGVGANLRYFDGNQWHELPTQDNWTSDHWLRIRAVGSDRILFTVSDGRDTAPDGGERMTELAYVMLGEKKVVLCDKSEFYP